MNKTIISQNAIIKSQYINKLTYGCSRQADIIKIIRYISIINFKTKSDASIVCLICRTKKIYNGHTILHHFTDNHITCFTSLSKISIDIFDSETIGTYSLLVATNG